MVAGGPGWAGCISIISRLGTEIKYIKYQNTAKDKLLVKIKSLNHDFSIENTGLFIELAGQSSDKITINIMKY